MDKVKIALTILTIAIMVGPLVCVTLLYRDNLLGLVIPPELINLASNDDTSNDTSLAYDINPPTPAGDPQYFPENKSYTFAYNFTNPFTDSISVDAFSAAIYSKEGVFLGNASLTNPMQIGAGENGIVDISGSLTEEAISYIKNNYSGSNINTVNVTLRNIDIDAAGLQVHLDQLPPDMIGSIPLPIGDLK